MSNWLKKLAVLIAAEVVTEVRGTIWRPTVLGKNRAPLSGRPTPSNDNEELPAKLDTDDMEALLGLRSIQIRKLRRFGRLPKPVRVRGKYFYDRGQVEAWIRTSRKEDVELILRPMKMASLSNPSVFYVK